MNDDLRWYRCIVKQVLDDDMVSIQFIDYGDFTVLMRACLAKLPEKFCILPPLAISVKLQGRKITFWGGRGRGQGCLEANDA